MTFKSPWIGTHAFKDLKPINVFHKQYDKVDLQPSPIKDYHVAFSGKLTAKKNAQYKVNISADDYYKLYINGQFVGQGVKPSYPVHQVYNSFDISEYLETGENRIVAHLYYNGDINRSYQSGDMRFGLIADIFENDLYISGTSSDWRYLELKEYQGTTTVGYETSYLEDIDFRLEEKGWRDKDHKDLHWLKAVLRPENDHVFEREPSPALDVYQIAPIQHQVLSNNVHLYDFGREITGQFTFKLKGNRDDKVILRCGEELIESEAFNKDSRVRFDMRCNCRYEESITLSGKVDEALFYDYKAFRYVELQLPKHIDIKDVEVGAILRHHPFKEILALESKDEDLKAIWDLCVHTLRVGAQELLVDCPTREKGQYLGDFTVSGLAHLYITGDLDYYRNILRDFARSSSICPGIMAVVPGSFMQEIADFSLLFGLQVLNFYRYTKDKSVLEEFLPVVDEILDHFSQYEREDGLLEAVSDKWNLVDWPDNLRDNYDFDLPDPARQDGCHNVINAYYIGAQITRNEILNELDLNTDDADIKKRVASFNKAFYDPSKKLYKDTESSTHHALHSNVLPAFFGFAVTSAHASLHQHILSKGLNCGVFFAYFVLKALCQIGAKEDAYELMLNTTEHGWINMLREGATTCFEAWGKDQKWNTSLCHPWATAPVILLNENFKEYTDIYKIHTIG